MSRIYTEAVLLACVLTFFRKALTLDVRTTSVAHTGRGIASMINGDRALAGALLRGTRRAAP